MGPCVGAPALGVADSGGARRSRSVCGRNATQQEPEIGAVVRAGRVRLDPCRSGQTQREDGGRHDFDECESGVRHGCLLVAFLIELPLRPGEPGQPYRICPASVEGKTLFCGRLLKSLRSPPVNPGSAPKVQSPRLAGGRHRRIGSLDARPWSWTRECRASGAARSTRGPPDIRSPVMRLECSVPAPRPQGAPQRANTRLGFSGRAGP